MRERESTQAGAEGEGEADFLQSRERDICGTPSQDPATLRSEQKADTLTEPPRRPQGRFLMNAYYVTNMNSDTGDRKLINMESLSLGG